MVSSSVPESRCLVSVCFHDRWIVYGRFIIRFNSGGKKRGILGCSSIHSKKDGTGPKAEHKISAAETKNFGTGKIFRDLEFQ